MDQNTPAIKLDSNESLELDGTISSWSKVESLKRMVKFVVSVCVLSLFIAIFSQFPHNSFNFNHGMERKYMFLICNGILFLLATCSVIEDSSSFSPNFEPCDHYSFSHSHHDHDHQFEPLVADHDHQFEPLVAAIEKQNQEQVEELLNEVQLEEGEDKDEDEDEDEGCFTDEIEEEDEEEEKGMELEMVVSTQELNKKIEEFIRKMKEEMRIEAAQTQLVAV